jgi:dUTP pyrophosphatase
MADTIQFLRTREVKSPSRANKHDAGIDFYVPEFTYDFLVLLKEKNPEICITNEYIILGPHEKVLIPSGIHCKMADYGRALVAANKSGVAGIKGLIYGAQVVDYEYQGEIHLSLINTGEGAVKITPGMKILQFLELPIYTSDITIFENMSINEFFGIVTTRGAAGFGSTDKK